MQIQKSLFDTNETLSECPFLKYKHHASVLWVISIGKSKHSKSSIIVDF